MQAEASALDAALRDGDTVEYRTGLVSLQPSSPRSREQARLNGWNLWLERSGALSVGIPVGGGRVKIRHTTLYVPANATCEQFYRAAVELIDTHKVWPSTYCILHMFLTIILNTEVAPKMLCHAGSLGTITSHTLERWTCQDPSSLKRRAQSLILEQHTQNDLICMPTISRYPVCGGGCSEAGVLICHFCATSAVSWIALLFGSEIDVPAWAPL